MAAFRFGLNAICFSPVFFDMRANCKTMRKGPKGRHSIGLGIIECRPFGPFSEVLQLALQYALFVIEVRTAFSALPDWQAPLILELLQASLVPSGLRALQFWEQPQVPSGLRALRF
jgi:hypothetical protein